MHEKGLTKRIVLYRKYTTSWKKDKGRRERREGEGWSATGLGGCVWRVADPSQDCSGWKMDSVVIGYTVKMTRRSDFPCFSLRTRTQVLAVLAVLV